MQCHCTRRPVLRNRVLWTWEIVTKILPAGRLSGKQDRSNVKGLKGETPEIQDTLAQSMTGGSVRLEAETVLCETTEDEKQTKKNPALLLSGFSSYSESRSVGSCNIPAPEQLPLPGPDRAHFPCTGHQTEFLRAVSVPRSCPPHWPCDSQGKLVKRDRLP